MLKLDLPAPLHTRVAMCDPVLSAALMLALTQMTIKVVLAVLAGAGLPFSALVPVIALTAAAILIARCGHRRMSIVAGVCAVFKMSAFASFYWCMMAFHFGRGFPLIDPVLAAIDARLGFDWMCYFMFIEHHPWMNDILFPAYQSIFWQPLLIAVALIALKIETEALGLILTFGIALALTTLAAVVVPAYGAYHYFGMSPALHPHLTNLVTGDGTAAAIDWLRQAQPLGEMPENRGGLISFPSFHTTAAVLFIYYCRTNRWLLGASILLNIVMLAAIPVHGSHYLADMIGGSLIAVISISATSWACRPSEQAPLRTSPRQVAGLAASSG